MKERPKVRGMQRLGGVSSEVGEGESHGAGQDPGRADLAPEWSSEGLGRGPWGGMGGIGFMAECLSWTQLAFVPRGSGDWNHPVLTLCCPQLPGHTAEKPKGHLNHPAVSKS